MLTEKRQKEILKLLGEKGSVTVQELTEKLNASESTNSERPDTSPSERRAGQGVWRSCPDRIQDQYPGRKSCSQERIEKRGKNPDCQVCGIACGAG